METNTNNSSVNNISALIHLSALSQYLFPLGNYILPIIIWNFKKNESEIINQNGKNVINFQLSMFLYSLIMIGFSIPAILYFVVKYSWHIHWQGISSSNIAIGTNIALGWVILGVILIFLFMLFKVAEFILIVYGTVKAANGEVYKYPLTIPFV